MTFWKRQPAQANTIRIQNPLDSAPEAAEAAVNRSHAALMEANQQMQDFLKKYSIVQDQLGQITYCQLPDGAARAGVDQNFRELNRQYRECLQIFWDTLSTRAGIREGVRLATNH